LWFHGWFESRLAHSALQWNFPVGVPIGLSVGTPAGFKVGAPILTLGVAIGLEVETPIGLTLGTHITWLARKDYPKLIFFFFFKADRVKT
jgi:hypothetical protein